MEKLNTLRARMLRDPVILILLLIPYFKPFGLTSSSSVLDWTFVAWKGLSLLCTLILFLGRTRVSAITVLMGAYHVLLLVSSWLSHGSISEAFYTAASVGGYFLLLELALQTDLRLLVKCATWLLGGLCTINLATVLMHPGGAYWPVVYFIGTDNSNALYILPLLGLAMMELICEKRPLPLQLGLLALFSASIFITWSATAVLSVTVFVILFFLFRVKKSSCVCNICVYYGLIFVVFLVIVVFRAQDRFSFLIEGLLHKDVTLTDRISLWDMSMQLIRESPWLGHGKWTNAMMWSVIGNVHCHNVVLQVLFETGVVGLALYLVMLGCVAWKLMPRRDHVVGYMLSATLGVLLLDLMAEAPIYPLPYYGILFLAWHVDEVIAALDPGYDLKT